MIHGPSVFIKDSHGSLHCAVYKVQYSLAKIVITEKFTIIINNNRSDEGLTLKRQLSKSFTVVIQPLSTRLIKPNFCLDLPHRRSTTVSLETRNPFTIIIFLHT